MDKALSGVAEKLGAEPCLLAIIVAFAIFAWILHRAYGHIERMEGLRDAQDARVNRRRQKDGTN
jgi:hypothetical protein